MSEERYQKFKKVLSQRQSGLTVLMDQVHKPHNLSAVVRSCDAVGIGQVHAVWLDDDLPMFHLTSGGSSKWVDIQTHTTIQAGISELQSRGFKVYAAHFSEEAIDFRDIDFTEPTAVLLGAELDGVSAEAQALVDGHIIIPMMGMVQSLNVSVANATILYEAQRQRMAAGMYDEPDLSPEEFERTLFEWMYPKLAEHCLKKGVPYPPLDEEGELAGELPR